MRTEILILLDRSGSMSSTKDDVIGGFNAMIDAQKKEKGECYLTLIQFDSYDPYEVVYTRRPIQEVAPLNEAVFVPRGSTPLLDAVAKTIVNQGARFDGALAKPEKVILVIFTDGMENASREYGKERVKALIDRQQREWNWTVTLIGANFDAITAGQSMGIAAADSLNFKQTPVGTRNAYAALNNKISSERLGDSYSYTVADRKGASDGDDSLLNSVVDTILQPLIAPTMSPIIEPTPVVPFTAADMVPASGGYDSASDSGDTGSASDSGFDSGDSGSGGADGSF